MALANIRPATAEELASVAQQLPEVRRQAMAARPPATVMPSPTAPAPMRVVSTRPATPDDYARIPRVSRGGLRAVGRGGASLMGNIGNFLSMAGVPSAVAPPVPPTDQLPGEVHQYFAEQGQGFGDGPETDPNLMQKALTFIGDKLAGAGEKLYQKPALRDPYAEQTPPSIQLRQEPLSFIGREAATQAPNIVPSIAAGLGIAAATKNPVAGYAGAVAASEVMETGDIFGSIINEIKAKRPLTDADRVYAKELALKYGTVNAALDALFPGSIVSKASRKQIVKSILSPQVAKYLAKETGAGLVKEVPTEIVQELNTMIAEAKGSGKQFTPREIKERLLRVTAGAGGVAATAGPTAAALRLQRAEPVQDGQQQNVPPPSPPPQPDVAPPDVAPQPTPTPDQSAAGAAVPDVAVPDATVPDVEVPIGAETGATEVPTPVPAPVQAPSPGVTPTPQPTQTGAVVADVAPDSPSAQTWNDSSQEERTVIAMTAGRGESVAAKNYAELSADERADIDEVLSDTGADAIDYQNASAVEDSDIAFAQTVKRTIAKGNAKAPDVLSPVIQHGTTFEKRLAAFMRNSALIDDVPVVGSAEDMKRSGRPFRDGTAGRYHPDMHLVGISGRADPAFMKQTVLHESIHAFTSRAMKADFPSDSRIGKAFSELDSLRKFFRNKMNTVEQDDTTRRFARLAVSSLEEFMTHSQTNPETQALMKRIKAGPRTVWQRFTRIMGRMLGVDPSDDSLLARVLEAGGNVLAELAVAEDRSFIRKAPPAGTGKYADVQQRVRQQEGENISATEGDAGGAEDGAAPEAITLPPKLAKMRDLYNREVADRIIRRFDALSDPVWNLPDSRQYKIGRYRTLGKNQILQEDVAEYRRQLMKASPDDQREIFRFLTSRVATTDKIGTLDLRVLARTIKDRINEIGKKLVAMGVISEQARARFEDRYLPRLYMYHLLQKGGSGKRSGKRAGKPSRLATSNKPYAEQRKEAVDDVWNNADDATREMMLGMAGVQGRAQLTSSHWDDLPAQVKTDMGAMFPDLDKMPQEVRQIMLGEITDPAYLATAALARPGRDIALLEFLAGLAGNNKWVPRQATMVFVNPVTGTKTRATPQFFLQEAKTLRDVAERESDPAVRAQTRQVADAMDKQSKSAIGSAASIDADTYRQLEDSPRYGALRGLWVHKDIYNDIVNSGLSSDPTDPTFLQKWLGSRGPGAKVTAVFKTAKVPLNVPSVIRNLVTGLVQLQNSGVPLARLPDLAVKAILEIKRKGSYYILGREGGIGAASFAANELYRAETDLMDLKRSQGTLGIFGGMHRLAAIIGNLAGDSYQSIEMFLKLMKLIHEKTARNASDDDAILEAHKWLLDYSLVNPAIRELRTSPVGAPFVTFVVKELPRKVEVLLKHPQRYIPWMVFYYSVPYLIAAMAGEDVEEMKHILAAMDDTTKRQGHTFVFPIKGEDGKWTAVPLSYFMPWAPYTTLLKSVHERARVDDNLLSAVYSQIDDNVLSDMLKITGFTDGPVLSLIDIFNTGTNRYTGEEVFTPSPDPAENFLRTLIHVQEMFTPTMLTSKGVVGLGVVGGELTTAGAVGDYLQGKQYDESPTQSPVRIAARLGGVNLRTVSEKEEKARQARRAYSEIKEMQDAAKKDIRNTSDLDVQERIGEDFKRKQQMAIERMQRRTGTDN